MAMVASTFVENYETEQPILELARFMNMSQQKAAGQDADMGDSELYQVRAPRSPSRCLPESVRGRAQCR